MTIDIQRTKLFIPPARPEDTPRRRLLERLDAGLRQGCRLTVISAPAGFGKTTLLSAWIAAGDRPAAWLSLDAGDNDPTRFWLYVGEALRSLPDLAAAGVGASFLAALQSPQPPPLRALLGELIHDLLAAPAPPAGPLRLCLVLDDYHLISEPQISDDLAFFIEGLPAPLHVVIASRVDLPAAFGRLRAAGQINELTEADLRFTDAEATVFFNQALQLALSPADVAALETRTEGWIVGLRMAGYALQGQRAAGDRSDYIAALSSSRTSILDYLTDEVLARQPAAVEAFLIQTSVLERLCGSLCDAVTGGTGGQKMIERLDAENLFVVPLDDQRHWYRYHHLFAELLRKRLSQLDPQKAPALHVRASFWYEKAHAIEEAIGHALAGADYARAARLIEQHAVRQMMGLRKEAAVARWLEELPDDVVRSRPWLSVYHAWVRYWRGQRDQVEECLRAAETALGRPSGPATPAAERRLMAGYIAAIRAHLALTDQDLPRVIAMAGQAIPLLPEGDFARCEAAVALGGAYWGLGNVVASHDAFAQGRATALKSGYPPLAVPSACYVGMQLTKQGRLHEAYNTYRQGLDWATGVSGLRQPVAGFPLVKLADLAREWGDLPAAARDLDAGVELCDQLGQADVMAEAQVMLARLRLAQGDTAGAWAALARCDEIAGRIKIDPWIPTYADECRLRLWLAAGDWSAAERWAAASGLTTDGELNYQHNLHHANLARLLIARGRAEPASPDLAQGLALLARLDEAAQRAGWVDERIRILLLQALGLQAAGDEPAALTALVDAMTLAEPGSYRRVFLDEGAPLLRLLRRAAPRAAPAYVTWLLDAFGQSS